MENNVLQQQIGGSHYTSMKMQPIVLITRAECDFIQGNIIKYISRYMNKNGAEDIKKCIHYAKLAIELLPENKNFKPTTIGLGYSYIKTNGLNKYQSKVILSTLENNYPDVINQCNQLLKEYTCTQSE